ncbi:hypothetical protein STIAU_6226 [Stigmatella aurantiaca DW4/3-1]|nr:hypothetical protein STIAU_6226 [Stigmatella aurantiaca DW4/3-1]
MAVLGLFQATGCGQVDEGLPKSEVTFQTTEQASSSTDYPGPCQGETTVSGTPQYLSSDYHGVNPDTRFITLPAQGRFRAGISCVGTAFYVIRIGYDSALCQQRGKCDPSSFSTMTQADLDFVATNYPSQVPIREICVKHGFGWYDGANAAPGTYLAIASSGSGFGGLVDGHGTMDLYAYHGNNGNWQPVNCSRPVPTVCGNGICEVGENGASCGMDCCDASTACGQTWMNYGGYYCRSFNGGSYFWTQPATCGSQYPYGTRSTCGGTNYYCCSSINNWTTNYCAY